MESKVGVAMGNESELVSRNADYTTCSNTEDGVAVFLERYFGQVS